MRPLGWALIQYDRCPYKRKFEYLKRHQGHMYPEEKPFEVPARELAVCKSKKEALKETNSIGTLILDFQPAEVLENKFLLFKQCNMWYLVIAALRN